MGLIFVVLIAAILVGLFVILMKVLSKRCPCIGRLQTAISRLLFFSCYIRSTMKGYLNFSISALLGLKQVNFDDLFSLFSTVGMALYVLIITPVFAYFFLKLNIKLLKREDFYGRFGSLYENLRTQHFSFVFQTILFFIRRLVFSFSIVFFGDVPLLQASIQVVSSMCIIVYTIHYKPYIKKKTYYFELFNEGTLLTCSYFLMVFCDILIDYEMRTAVGWYMVIATLLNIGVNWMSLVYSLLKKMCKKCKQMCQKKQKQPQIEQIKQPNLAIADSQFSIQSNVDLTLDRSNRDLAQEMQSHTNRKVLRIQKTKAQPNAALVSQPDAFERIDNLIKEYMDIGKEEKKKKKKKKNRLEKTAKSKQKTDYLASIIERAHNSLAEAKEIYRGYPAKKSKRQKH